MKTTICTVDLETTGLNHDYHEIIQWAILPLTDKFEADTTIEPFNVRIKAQFPERADKKALEVNGLDITQGLSCFSDAKIHFEIWKAKYGIGQIEPLCQNAFFDLSFLRKYYNHDQFEEIFHTGRIRDTKIQAQAINDAFNLKEYIRPFRSTSLKAIAELHGIDYTGAHDALRDCEITAEAYQTEVKEPKSASWGDGRCKYCGKRLKASHAYVATLKENSKPGKEFFFDTFTCRKLEQAKPKYVSVFRLVEKEKAEDKKAETKIRT